MGRGSLAGLVLVCLAGLAWFALGDRDGSRGGAAGPGTGSAALDRAETALEAAQGVQRKAPEAVGAAAESAPGEDGVPTEGLAREDEGPRDRCAFHGRLVLPDHSEVLVEHVEATLTDANGESFAYTGTDVDTIEFPDLPCGSYELAVRADGYRHRPETFVLPFAEGQDYTIESGIRTERVTLWPAAWIPVVVLTRDGRPFAELAAERGWEPKRLFVDAFRVAVSLEPPSAADPHPAEPRNDLAIFHPVPGYQKVVLPGSVACSLELLEDPPLHVGLWVHGVFHSSQLVLQDDRELVFRVDQTDLDASLAQLTARLVDAESGTPITDARATLKADTSAHRRDDLSNRSPGDDGMLRFEHVIPGRHELTIEREGSLVQRRIALSPAEHRDLGDIAIRMGPGLTIRLVDANGDAVRCVVEVAPYERGVVVDDHYPPNLHRHCEGDGVYVLPVPDRPSIVRLRTRSSRVNYTYPIVTGNVLVDPAALPPELVLVALEHVDVKLEPSTPLVDGHRYVVEDALGLVVDRVSGPAEGTLRREWIPGDYLVRRFEGDVETGWVRVSVQEDGAVLATP